jgi:aspartate 1-decarboxylase
MLVKALKGKIHRGRVTSTKIDYPGSIGVDSELLAAANIRPYEEVLLANVTNGERVETYVVHPRCGGAAVQSGRHRDYYEFWLLQR